MHAFHEATHRSLFNQRGMLKEDLVQRLRSKRQIRRSVHAKATGQSEAGPSMLSRSANDLPDRDCAIPVTVRELAQRLGPQSHPDAC